MKVLIVDDEKHVREGIKILAKWDENGIEDIYEASNGEEAIQMIEEKHPEIIFSDMKMPKMDGTLLLEWIKNNHPHSKTIIITGYEDYHYMRKAMNYGSSDYLLKPIDPEVLNNAIRTVIHEWKVEEKERKNKVINNQLLNRMKPVYRDRKLTQLLYNDSYEENVFEGFSLPKHEYYHVGLLYVNEEIRDYFKGDSELTYFTILNIINEVLSRKSSGMAFHNLGNTGEIILILWEQKDEMISLLNLVIKSIQNSLGILFSIAVGKEVTKLEDISESYQRAKALLMCRNVLVIQQNNIYMGETEDEEIKSLMDYTETIKLAVQTGNIQSIDSFISQIHREIITNNRLSLKQLLQLESEYVVISRSLFKEWSLPLNLQSNIEENISKYFNRYGIFLLENYIERKKRETQVFLKRVQKKKSKSNNVMNEIEKFIRNNYNHDIKLQEISDHFYISREYISRKFKQEYGVNISEYIINIRMESAKELLQNSNLKIYEIANRIGYQDDKYFRKVFKKLIGVTPNEYRDNQKIT